MLGFITASCSDFLKLEDIDTSNVNFKNAKNLDYVFPLAKGEAQLNEILKGHNIGNGYLVDKNGKLFIQYKDKKVFSYKFSDIFDNNIPTNEAHIKFPKNGFPETLIPVPTSILKTILDKYFPKQEGTIEFNLPKTITEINEFIFDCSLNLHAKDVPLNLDIEITFPELQDDKGKTLVVNHTLKKATEPKTIPFEGIQYNGKDKGNKINLSYIITSKVSDDNDSSINFVKGNKIDLKLSFEKVTPIRFKGKTDAIKKELPKYSNDTNFENFDKIKDLILFGSELKVNVETKGVLGEAQLTPIFVKKNKSESDINIEYRNISFNSLNKKDSQEISFKGKKIESVVNELLKNNLETKAEIILNPNGEEFTLTKDTEINVGLTFEQPLNLSLKDMEINYTTDLLDCEELLKDYKENLDNCSLVIWSETDIPLEIKLDNIDILDKNEKPIGRNLKVNGLLKGSTNGKFAKSRVVGKIMGGDIKKMIATKEVYLKFKGHLKSIDEKQVTLQPKQKLKLKVVLGINHDF